MNKETNSMNRYPLAFLNFSILLLSVKNSFAVRTGGNGGGLTEMKFIYLFQNVHFYLKPCMTATNPCGLDESTSLMFSTLLQKIGDNSSPYRIEFASKMSGDTAFVQNQDHLTVYRAFLYQDDGRFETMQNLIAFTVAVRLAAHHILEFNIGTLKKLQNIYSLARTAEKIFRANNSSVFLQLISLSTEFAEFKNILHLLEDKKETYDLSEDVKRALPCGDLLDWNFSNWSGTQIGQRYFMFSEANSTCFDGGPVSLLIEFNISKENLILQDSIRVYLKPF